MHIVVVANGVLNNAEQAASLIHNANLVVAADGGANWLWRQGLPTDVLIGDLDSILPEALAALEAAGCTILRHPAAKDETDTELALIYAAHRDPSRITLIGALGGRVDHEVANLMLLGLPELQRIHVVICDGDTRVRLLPEGRSDLIGAAGDIVSLLPWGGDCHGITTIGLAYPLHDEPLLMGGARGISNVMLERRATIDVRSGRLLLVHTQQAGSGATPAQREQ
jgi:thiamine pyrophosphokinase